MSDSDPDLDINALRDIFGDGVTDFAPEKKKKQSKPKKAQKSRPKKKKRTPINLDALMEGVNLDNNNKDNNDLNGSDNEIDYLNLIKDQSNGFSLEPQAEYIPQKQKPKVDPFIGVEKRVSDYLEISLRSVHNEIINEIEQLLIENDNFDPIIFDFLQSLQDSIRDHISYEKANFEKRNTGQTLFNDFSESFLETFRSAGKFTALSNSRNPNMIRSCRNLVKTRIPALKRQLSDAFKQLGSELSDLNNIRNKNNNTQSDFHRKYRQQHQNSLDLESKLTLLEELNEGLSNRIEKFHNYKNEVLSHNENVFIEPDILIKRMRKLSGFLRVSKKKIMENGFDMIKDYVKKLSIANEELNTSIIQSCFMTEQLTSNNFIYQQKVKLDMNSSSTVKHTSKFVEDSNNEIKLHQANRESQYQQINSFLNDLNTSKRTPVFYE
ncbi:hypothetical protein TRFO_06414 [Tritrichomonas foetus]|uniref:Uncharacterized protein n=1 Tax=Tritrichomonas foetus TaxID=1144522 RepID=A0A1J4JY80_9EUKA|nr:hypothetical protein TRFO_06414 [Tritrichomonas foetus]|eukprot:OHT04111.1 hypothetical protein TRFO_06414 [Tritrichomonas foetus]